MRVIFFGKLVKPFVAVLLLFGLVFASAPAHAAYSNGLYSDGVYGDCSGTECPTTTGNTVVTTPSGLQVAINLVSGQVIPLGIYNLRVTPLNGQGKTFSYVQFYLDGQLVSTFYPDKNGTAIWPWDTNKYQGTTVKIIVYDADGSRVTKEFDITIEAAKSDNPVAQVVSFLTNTVKAIPTPLAVSIPYIFLVALLFILILLFAQSRREADETENMRLALLRASRLSEEKDGFMQLTSHYLRTPLTLIKSGVDFLSAAQPVVNQMLINNLITTSQDFGNSIEMLLGKASNDQRLQTIQASSNLTLRRIWTMPLFWLPVVLIGLLMTFLDFLLIQAHKIDFLSVGMLTQVSLYIAMAVGLYVAIRSRQLSQHDRQVAKQQESQQIAIDEARNELIRQASETLANKLQKISDFIPQLSEGQPKKLITDGCARIGEVLKRFKATAIVIPPITTMQYAQFRFSSLMDKSFAPVSQAAANKHVSVKMVSQDVALASQQPAWVVQTLASVLDNAVAYSKEGGSVEVGAGLKDGVATISVQDHGTGIAPDKIQQLFQPFSKAEGALQFDHPGIGLSLYLGRLLMTSLGGSINITSNLGQGTLVAISFPVK